MRKGQFFYRVTVQIRQGRPIQLLLFPTLILLVVCACFGERAAGADLPSLSPVLTVQVYNYRHAPSRMLALAERESGEILKKAGLHVIWRDCPSGPVPTIPVAPCSEGDRRDLLRLVVVAGPKQNVVLDTISGLALPPSTVGVFYDYLPHLPEYIDTPKNRAMVLGCVMAHEIGHLLLGSHGHSISGIMQAAWGAEELSRAVMGQLVFLKEESEMMRVAVQARMEQRLGQQSSAPIVRPTK